MASFFFLITPYIFTLITIDTRAGFVIVTVSTSSASAECRALPAAVCHAVCASRLSESAGLSRKATGATNNTSLASPPTSYAWRYTIACAHI